MICLVVSSHSSKCSACTANVTENVRNVTECPTCRATFNACMMTVETTTAFHETLPHVSPFDYPSVNTAASTFYRSRNRQPFEVAPE